MQPAGPADLLELAAKPGHAIADHPAVGFDLRLAGAAEEAETTALALEVGPRPDEPSGLVIEVGEFDLQAAFGGRGALTEDLEDQTRAVDHLALELFLEVALLDRGERAIDDDQLSVLAVAGHGDVLDLPFTEQGAGPRLADRNGEGFRHHDPDRQGQATGLLQTRVDIHRRPLPHRRIDDDGPGAARNLSLEVVVIDQSSSSSSSSSPPVRSTGVTGWIVDTACL